jgi:hypothetical protein
MFVEIYLLLYSCFNAFLGEVSICSEAPSLSELSRELAQWDDLLSDSPSANDGDSNQDLDGLHIEVLCQTKSENSQTSNDSIDKLDMDLVRQLGSILMPSPNIPSNEYSLRPTAASLGLKDTIEECLKDVEDVTGIVQFMSLIFVFFFKLVVCMN